MARHLLHLPVFAWKTNYAGNFETAIIAVPFKLFGSSVLLMKLTVASLHVVACLFAWRIGRRLIDARAGIVAGLALWIWPGVFVWWSTKARDYEVLLVCGLVTLLCAVRLIDEAASRRRDWLWFGLAAGIGWWTNPQIAYLAAPALLWIAIGNRSALRSILWAAPTFLIGAAPWIVWNLRYHWGSLHSSFEATEGYGAHLARFWREGIPVALGLRWPQAWLFPHARLLAFGMVGAGVVALAMRRRPGALYLAVALLVYPLIHALTPVAGYTGEGRYLYLYAPLIALAVGYAVRTPAVTVIAFGLMAVLSVGQLTTMHSGVSGMASNLPIPEKMGGLVRTLKAERIDAVWADYWLAYRLTFVSNERVIASAVAGNRYRPYEEHVRRSRRSAWVYVAGSIADQHFTAALDHKGVPYRTLRPGRFAVHIPNRPVLPEEVPLD